MLGLPRAPITARWPLFAPSNQPRPLQSRRPGTRRPAAARPLLAPHIAHATLSPRHPDTRVSRVLETPWGLRPGNCGGGPAERVAVGSRRTHSRGVSGAAAYLNDGTPRPLVELDPSPRRHADHVLRLLRLPGDVPGLRVAADEHVVRLQTPPACVSHLLVHHCYKCDPASTDTLW